ncbi:MAG: Rpn family recombination-promoting nuclease/putative transposase [Planctomycetaceae bacterium]|jgi:hypothetical protein|nr:Rpn family recombination-promoting nuclease/putative transposase [Planctomycetaceae bacterium]
MMIFYASKDSAFDGDGLPKKISKNILQRFPKVYNQDEFCKDFFLNINFARIILRYILGREVLDEIDLDRLELAGTTFLTFFLRSLYADVIYRVPLKDGSGTYIYLLIDFKSDSRRQVVDQLYGYAHNIWMRPTAGVSPRDYDEAKQYMKMKEFDSDLSKLNKRTSPFPCVISMIFHCGKKKFTAPTNIVELVDLPPDSKLRKKIINYGCDVFDLSLVPESELPKEPCAYLFFRTLQICHSRNVNEEALALFEKLKEEFRADRDLWEPLDKCLYHLFTSSKYFRQETHTLIIKLVKELGVEVMVDSVATRLYREGEAIGIARGKAIGKAKSIIRFLRNRVGMPSVELQEKIESIRSTDKLDELLDFASTCVSIGEFETAFN